jgi:hypothetical protein
MFKDAEDYFALAKTILPRARDGDAAAQYMLWEIHFLCFEAGYGVLAEDHGRPLTWDEALQKAARLNVPAEIARQQYGYCHRFFSEDVADLGDAMAWLQRATDNKYPRAQARTAGLRLAQDQQMAFQRAGAEATGLGLLPPIGGDINPRDLLRSAVASLDPDAIQDAANIIPSLDRNASTEERRIVSAAWLYVACQRGANCSFYGKPDMSYCAPTDQNCIGVPQRLLEWTNYNWEPVQQRANEINAALDARQWDKLGLGGP